MLDMIKDTGDKVLLILDDCISDRQINIEKRKGEMDTTLANIDKIGDVIGWKPEVDVIDWVAGQE